MAAVAYARGEELRKEQPLRGAERSSRRSHLVVEVGFGTGNYPVLLAIAIGLA